MSKSLEKELDRIIRKILSEDDDITQPKSPKKGPVKLDGKKKKAAEGAHKFDKQTEYNNLDVTEEFDTREDHKYSKNARPDLD